MSGSRSFWHVVASFRTRCTAPDEIDGIGWSDHWSFWQLGYPAVMVTDTALFRYRHYHKPTDTPDKVDKKLARITWGSSRPSATCWSERGRFTCTPPVSGRHPVVSG